MATAALLAWARTYDRRRYAYSSRPGPVIELAMLVVSGRAKTALLSKEPRSLAALAARTAVSGSSAFRHAGLPFGNFVDAVSSLTLVGGFGGTGGQSYDHSSRSVRAPPSGGTGGRGGHVYFAVNPNVSDLSHIRVKKIVGGQGASGQAEGAAGSAGKDEHIEVPLGTLVHVHAYQSSSEAQAAAGCESAEGEKLRHPAAASPMLYTLDMNEPGMIVRVAVGGSGGPGNRQLHLQSMAAEPRAKRSRRSETKSSEDSEENDAGKVPSLHERDETLGAEQEAAATRPRLGAPGSMMRVSLELRVISDVGLVGPPNAGKSSLLSVLTRARPRVGHWPFTTLAPSLGILAFNERPPYHDPMTIADIPGLIHGARCDVGLGLDFLKHIARCSVLVLVLDGSLRSSSGSYGPVDDYKMLRQEMHAYHPLLSLKPFVILINKADQVSVPARAGIVDELTREVSRDALSAPVHMAVKIAWVSAKTKEGVANSIELIRQLASRQGKTEGETNKIGMA